MLTFRGVAVKSMGANLLISAFLHCTLSFDIHKTPTWFLRLLPSLDFSRLEHLILNASPDHPEYERGDPSDRSLFTQAVLRAANITTLSVRDAVSLNIPFIFERYPNLKTIAMPTWANIDGLITGTFPSLREVTIIRGDDNSEHWANRNWRDINTLNLFTDCDLFPSVEGIRIEGITPPNKNTSDTFNRWWNEMLRRLDALKIKLRV